MTFILAEVTIQGSISISYSYGLNSRNFGVIYFCNEDLHGYQKLESY